MGTVQRSPLLALLLPAIGCRPIPPSGLVPLTTASLPVVHPRLSANDRGRNAVTPVNLVTLTTAPWLSQQPLSTNGSLAAHSLPGSPFPYTKGTSL